MCFKLHRCNADLAPYGGYMRKVTTVVLSPGRWAPWLLASLFALAGCSSPTGVSELGELSIAEARWEAERPHAYVFEVRKSCFCPPEYVEWHRVQVEGTTIIGIVHVESGQPVPTDRWTGWESVDELFEDIRNFIDSDIFGRVEGAYHPTLGYPLEVNLIAREGIADAGLVVTIRSLEPRPLPALR